MPVAAHRALWVLQILLGLFFVLASALPKFWGDPVAVAIFDGIGSASGCATSSGSSSWPAGSGCASRASPPRPPPGSSC